MLSRCELETKTCNGDFENAGFLYCNIYLTSNYEIVFFSAFGNNDVAKILSGRNKTVRLRIDRQSYSVSTKDFEMAFDRRGEIAHIVIKRKSMDETLIDCQQRAYIFTDEDYSDIDFRGVEDDLNKIPKEVEDKVFDLIVKCTSLPLLEEWKHFIARYIARCYNIDSVPIHNFCPEENIDVGFKGVYWVDIKPDRIKAAISTGLNECSISIDGSNRESELLRETNGLTDYVNNFGDALSRKVIQDFTPLFNPDKENVSDSVTNYAAIAATHSSIIPYDKQMEAIEAACRSMDKNKFTLIGAEPGSGKTQISLGIAESHARKRKHTAYSAIVMCPSTMANEWKENIETVIPFSSSYFVTSLSDVLAIKKVIENPLRHRPVFGIITYGDAKSDYEEKPAYFFNKARGRFECPYCKFAGEERYIGDDYSYSSLDDINIAVKDDNNAKCPRCGTKLWEPVTKENVGDWVKIKKGGWFLRSRLGDVITNIEERVIRLDSTPGYLRRRHNISSSFSKKLSSLKRSIVAFINGNSDANVRAPKKFSVARYVRQHCRHLFDYAIFDELHSLEGETAQNRAFNDLYQATWKSIGLTGTLSNGYASGLFNILFRTQTKKMIEDGFGYGSCDQFVERYGVIEEKVIEHLEVYSNRWVQTENGRIPEDRCYRRLKKDTKKKAIAGVSPMVFANYLINNTVFMKQEDITKELVPYTEIPMPIEMDPDLKNVHDSIMTYIATRNFEQTAEGRTHYVHNYMLKQIVPYISMYLDQPYGHDDIYDTQGNAVIEAVDLDDEKIRNKEQALIDLCLRKKEAGEKVLVYVHWTNKLDIQNRLKTVLEKNGVKADIMDSVDQKKRQAWLNARANKVDAVILNPRLIDVGLNLLDYTTIVFYEIGNQLSVIRQSSKRSWRINQTHPVEVYFMYYAGTVQEQLLSLISSKLKAATAIEGNFTEEGLSSMSETSDIMTAIAKNIAENTMATVDNANFETIGTEAAAEARKARVVNQIRLGLKPKFAYSGSLRNFNSMNLKLAKNKHFQNVERTDYYSLVM